MTVAKKLASSCMSGIFCRAMSCLWKTFLFLLALSLLMPSGEATQGSRIDLTKPHPEIGTSRGVPLETRDLKRNNSFTEERVPVKMWHAQFSPLGQRRSSIDVSERTGKNIIQPRTIEMDRKDMRTAPQNRRMAYVRNFDRVRDTRLTPQYGSDAEVANVQRMVRPPPANKSSEDLSMRDINRFTFQRNHQDTGGVRTEKAGSNAK